MRALEQEEQGILDGLDAASFGRAIAKVIKENPWSQNWLLVSQAITLHSGVDAEHELVAAAIDKFAGEPADGGRA